MLGERGQGDRYGHCFGESPWNIGVDFTVYAFLYAFFFPPFRENILILLSETFKLKELYLLFIFWKENTFLRTMKNSEF